MTISLQGVSAGYSRKQRIVHAVDLEIRPGEVTVLIGPNGCGKSTLLKTIARILKPSAGRIIVDGADTAHLAAKVMGRSIAFLPQSPAVPSAISVEALVGYGRAPHQSILGFRSPRDIEMVDAAIATTGLETLRHQSVSELSGGQRQRAFLAMSLAQDTPWIMLDEPTTFLDVRHQFETLDLVQRLNQEGRTTIVVLHDIAQAARYGDRLVVMHEGRLVASGPPREVVTPELISRVYGMDCEIYDDPVSGTPVVARR